MSKPALVRCNALFGDGGLGGLAHGTSQRLAGRCDDTFRSEDYALNIASPRPEIFGQICLTPAHLA